MKLSWDERWQKKKGDAIPAADPWLTKHQNLFNGGLALDLACGRGRNALFLARAGYRILALDSSQAALDLLGIESGKDDLPIDLLCRDLQRGLPRLASPPDLILCCFYLQRNLFPAIKEQLAPGGLFIARSFCQRTPTTEVSEIIFQPQELAGCFDDWEILAYEEGVETAERGGTLAGIVARKPQN
jgi:SAM-dependent methyltransferase